MSHHHHQYHHLINQPRFAHFGASSYSPANDHFLSRSQGAGAGAGAGADEDGGVLRSALCTAVLSPYQRGRGDYENTPNDVDGDAAGAVVAAFADILPCCKHCRSFISFKKRSFCCCCCKPEIAQTVAFYCELGLLFRKQSSVWLLHFTRQHSLIYCPSRPSTPSVLHPSFPGFRFALVKSTHWTALHLETLLLLVHTCI